MQSFKEIFYFLNYYHSLLCSSVLITLKWQTFCSKIYFFAWESWSILGKRRTFMFIYLSIDLSIDQQIYVTDYCAHINICSCLGDFPLGKVGPLPSDDALPVLQCVPSCLTSSSLCTCPNSQPKFNSECSQSNKHSDTAKRNHVLSP